MEELPLSIKVFRKSQWQQRKLYLGSRQWSLYIACLIVTFRLGPANIRPDFAHTFNFPPAPVLIILLLILEDGGDMFLQNDRLSILHGVTTQKTILFMAYVVIKSNEYVCHIPV
jgi:hypothetical protein